MKIDEIIKHWKHISPVIREPQNEVEYVQLADLLDHLLDIVGEDESHELIGLIDIISHLISLYDDAHIEPLLMNTEINTLKGVNHLPNAPDDFFPEGRSDSKPQDSMDNE